MNSQQLPDAQGDFVQSLARGLELLRLVGASGGALGVAEAADKTGLNRATARRLLKTLETLGYLDHSGREYRLTSRVLELGYHYLTNLGISELVSGPIEALSDLLGEAVSVTVREATDIVYVARARPARVMTVSLGIGARIPVWHTSMGRVLLAALNDDELSHLVNDSLPDAPRTSYSIVDPGQFLSEIAGVRERGFSLVNQEFELGLRSLAVPLTRAGVVVAALNVATAQVGETPEESQKRILPELQATARTIAALLEQVPRETLALSKA